MKMVLICIIVLLEMILIATTASVEIVHLFPFLNEFMNSVLLFPALNLAQKSIMLRLFYITINTI